MPLAIPFRSESLSLLINDPGTPGTPLLALGHGANGGMRHPLLEEATLALAARGIGTVRFNFPFAEEGKASPNSDVVLVEAWDSVIQTLRACFPGRPLVIGGKSLGGRTAAVYVQTRGGDGVAGLVFLGFPLHAPGRVGLERGLFLRELGLPAFFAQGSRDSMANPELIRKLVASMGGSRLRLMEGGDHSLRVAGGAGQEQRNALWDELASWIEVFSLSGSG